MNHQKTIMPSPFPFIAFCANGLFVNEASSGNGIHNKLNILHTSLNKCPYGKDFFSQRSSVEWHHISLVLPLGVQFSIFLTQEAIESFAFPGKIDEIENVFLLISFWFTFGIFHKYSKSAKLHQVHRSCEKASLDQIGTTLHWSPSVYQSINQVWFRRLADKWSHHTVSS